MCLSQLFPNRRVYIIIHWAYLMSYLQTVMSDKALYKKILMTLSKLKKQNIDGTIISFSLTKALILCGYHFWRESRLLILKSPIKIKRPGPRPVKKGEHKCLKSLSLFFFYLLFVFNHFFKLQNCQPQAYCNHHKSKYCDF